MIVVQYVPLTGEIVACGAFTAAPAGLMLGYVFDAEPLALPGRKWLIRGRVVVTPPSPPTAGEFAVRRAQVADRSVIKAFANATTPTTAEAVSALQALVRSLGSG